MWEMQILQKGSTAGDATDSETGESGGGGSSSHSVDDNRQNYCAVRSTAAAAAGDCSPVRTKHCTSNSVNAKQAIINVSGIHIYTQFTRII